MHLNGGQLISPSLKKSVMFYFCDIEALAFKCFSQNKYSSSKTARDEDDNRP